MNERQSANLPKRGNRTNVGAIEQPFSGVGMEFDPIGSPTIDTDFALHEIGYWPNDYDWNFSRVYSPFWRAYYCFEQGHFVRFEDRDIPLGPDRILVIPNHLRYDCFGPPPVPKFWIHFSCRWSVEPSASMPISIETNEIYKVLISRLSELLEHERQSDRSEIRRLGLTFLIYLINDKSIPRQAFIPEDIQKIVQHINDAPGHPWANAEMAEMVSIGVHSFIRRFKKYTGETPIKYVQQIRIREACRLLSTTELTIENIAAQMGFPDRFYFSRVFKKQTSQSPAAYRKAKLK